MDGFQFITSLVESWVKLLADFSWPLAVVVMAFLFRKDIHRLLLGLKSLKMGAFDARFRQELEDAQEIAAEITSDAVEAEEGEGAQNSTVFDFDKIAADAHPTGVVMEIWKTIESMLEILVERYQPFDQGSVISPGQIAKNLTRSPLGVERQLAKMKLISSDEAALLRKMRTLRNHVAHSKMVSLSPSEVREYMELAQTVERFLGRAISELSSK